MCPSPPGGARTAPGCALANLSGWGPGGQIPEEGSRVARWAEKLPAGEGVGWTSLGTLTRFRPLEAKGWRASRA
eukprot:scaffold50049_cov78-Phaeocystis_antarctica.AAC.1